MQEMLDKLEFYLHFFGYAKDDREEKTLPKREIFNSFEPTNYDFYDYKGKASKKNQDSFLDFLNVNERMFKLRLEAKAAEEEGSVGSGDTSSGQQEE